MTTNAKQSYLNSDEDTIQQLIARPLAADADLFAVADNCTALVTVLVDTDDSKTKSALCERLQHALRQLRQLCDGELPPHLVAQLVEGEKLTSCVPECWQETATQVDYALALTQAIAGGTLAANVAEDLTSLLHDMVWMMAEYVREPYIAAH